ncbi:hypothetical protein KGF54_003557 [Candida jiufengensis]|uniref:uncharacterized protein n=1 Tax=Candida jiufengensis TaxID=497108 RepID=UPI002224291C|nr:uncharacterized protein KGF54_003557 [Candida jiufengensis]KAI5952690.1 hypothetical protein KGF54_003557 [Candida jiufengensis]
MDQDDTKFEIIDQNNIPIIIHLLYTISLKSVLNEIPTENSLNQSQPNLLSETSQVHFFRSGVKIRRNIYLVKLKFGQDDKFEKFGVLYPVVNDIFGIFRVDCEIPETDDCEEMPEITNSEGLFTITKDMELSRNLNLPQVTSFSMKPPSKVIREEFQDPLHFLQNRYYQSLYSLNEPLVYFPKTSISRFRNICVNEDRIIEILSSMIMTIESFDLRYEVNFLANSNTSEIELTHKLHFMDKNGIRVVDDKIEGITTDQLQKILLELKTREAQLQIILIFELLLTKNINEEEFLSKNLKKQNSIQKKSQESQKINLVRSKKKKTVKPIVMEVLSNEFFTYIYMNKIIDRLNLWEVLISNKNKDSKNILPHVLILYYHKSLPHLTKYVIENLKNINMKLTTSSKKSKADLHKVEKKIDRPKLTKNNDNDQLIKDISISSIKRSKSNLGQSKDLDKRQINLDLKSPKTKSIIEEPSQLIFSKAKKSKSIPNLSSSSTTSTNLAQFQSFSQIQATPAKQRTIDLALEVFTPTTNKDNEFVKPTTKNSMTSKLQSIAQHTEETDDDDNELGLVVNSSPQKSIVSVEATPQKPSNSSKMYQTIEATPQQGKNIDATPQKSKVIEATPKQTKIIEATPQKVLAATPRKRLINGTPKQVVATPSIKKPTSTPKTKPGDPIPLSNSPIYNAYNSSKNLFNDDDSNDDNDINDNDKSNNNDYDYEYDSDEILNPTKKSKSTYFRK